MTEGIRDPARQPAVLFTDRTDLGGARGHGAPERGLGIVDDQQHPRRGAAYSLGTMVGVSGCLVRYPEGSAAHRELRNHRLFLLGATDAVLLDGAEGGLVELNGGAPAPNGQLRHDSRPRRMLQRLSGCGHRTLPPSFGSG